MCQRFASALDPRAVQLMIEQDRVTDHRIPLTMTGLHNMLDGGPTIDDFAASLREKEEDERIQELLDAQPV